MTAIVLHSRQNADISSPVNASQHMPQVPIAPPPHTPIQQRQNGPPQFPQPFGPGYFAPDHNVSSPPQSGPVAVTSPENNLPSEAESEGARRKRRRTTKDQIEEAPIEEQQAGCQTAGDIGGPPLLPRNAPNNYTPASGPMEKGVIIPPRAKPGRKPKPPAAGDDKDNDAIAKRREQNRIAQEAFRKKNAARIDAITAERDHAYNMYNTAIANMQQLQTDKANLQRELEEKTRRLQEYESMNERNDSISPNKANTNEIAAAAPRQPHTRGPKYENLNFAAPLTPPDNSANEIDFTNFGRTVPATHPHNNSSDPLGPSGLGDDDRCGFCTDAQNCLCKQDPAPVPEIEGPGNCAACIADPQRAQACRQLAASANVRSFGFRPLHADDSVGNGGGVGGNAVSGGFSLARSDSHHSGRISCEQLMDRAKDTGTRLASIAELFGDQIKAHPTATGRYEVEEHEAAQALQTLSTRTTTG
jgi:hypothetical protein